MEQIILTDNGKKVLSYMQEKNSVVIGKDMGEELEMKGIYLVLNSLIKKELVVADAIIVRDFTNNKGEVKPKEYKTYSLTELGKNYII